MEIKEQIDTLKSALEREKAARKAAETLLKERSSELGRISKELEQSNALTKELSNNKKATPKTADCIELSRLKEQNKQLNILFDNSPVGMFLSNPMGMGLTYSNDACCKIVGLTHEELKTENIDARIHQDDISRFQKKINAMYSGEIEAFSIEFRFYTGERKIIWVRLSLKAVRDASGKIVLEAGIAEDITQKKELNERTKLSEILLANLIAGAPIGILMVNEFGRVTLANKKLCDIFSLTAAPEELVGYEGSVLSEQCKSSARDPERFIEKVKQLHEQKSGILKEEIEFADGRVFKRNCMPLTYQGKYRGLIVSYYDTSSVKNFEDKLKQQKEKYATVIANMNLGWTETDPEGRITWANQSFCELSGYTLAELIGQQAQELLFANDSRNNSRFYNDQEQKIYQSHGIQIKTKNGTIKHLLVSGMHRQDVDGETNGAIGIQFDITELKELELQKAKLLKELESQNEQLNDYAHVVSHDLKSPLRSISALVAWSKEDFSKGIKESALKSLDLIEEKIEKMDALIENILRYSSLNQGHFCNTEVDLNLLVQETLEMILVPENVKISILKTLPVLNADATKMQQLFQNLLSNAINHIDKPTGKVEIDFFDDTSHYRFTIKDNGKGIKKSNQDKIFKIFRTFDDNENSTGIGLSIVKKIVEIYQGEIWLESEIGVGTTFFFTLKKHL